MAIPDHVKTKIRTKLADRMGQTLPATKTHKAMKLNPEEILLESWIGNNGERNVITVHADTFAEMMGLEVLKPSDKLTKQKLKDLDPDDVRGYHKYIDQWQEEGLLDT